MIGMQGSLLGECVVQTKHKQKHPATVDLIVCKKWKEAKIFNYYKNTI